MNNHSFSDALQHNDFAAFQSAVRNTLSVSPLVRLDQVGFMLGKKDCRPFVRWLMQEYNLDVTARDKGGALILGGVVTATLPTLCEEFGFDVNSLIYLDNPSMTYASNKLLGAIISDEGAKLVVFHGAHNRTPCKPQYQPLFQSRSRCARAIAALLAVLKPRDLARLVAGLVWGTRVECEVWL